MLTCFRIWIDTLVALRLIEWLGLFRLIDFIPKSLPSQRFLPGLCVEVLQLCRVITDWAYDVKVAWILVDVL